MNNPKIEKVKDDIEKMRGKIADFQGKLRILERKKIDLENEEIIALVRSERISDTELNTLMQSLRREPAESEPPAVNETEDENEYYKN